MNWSLPFSASFPFSFIPGAPAQASLLHCEGMGLLKWYRSNHPGTTSRTTLVELLQHVSQMDGTALRQQLLSEPGHPLAGTKLIYHGAKQLIKDCVAKFGTLKAVPKAPVSILLPRLRVTEFWRMLAPLGQSVPSRASGQTALTPTAAAAYGQHAPANPALANSGHSAPFGQHVPMNTSGRKALTAYGQNALSGSDLLELDAAGREDPVIAYITSQYLPAVIKYRGLAKGFLLIGEALQAATRHTDLLRQVSVPVGAFACVLAASFCIPSALGNEAVDDFGLSFEEELAAESLQLRMRERDRASTSPASSTPPLPGELSAELEAPGLLEEGLLEEAAGYNPVVSQSSPAAAAA